MSALSVRTICIFHALEFISANLNVFLARLWIVEEAVLATVRLDHGFQVLRARVS